MLVPLLFQWILCRQRGASKHECLQTSVNRTTVRPNETGDANQPWHWVVIPAMGLCMGEIFYLKELAQDCHDDGVYEFFFCGPPLIITGGTGSPINPQAIK